MSNLWTTNNIPDQSGKVIIVTGANSGIGYEATRELARKGATVVMACRNMAKAEPALSELKKEQPNAIIDLIHLDLASLKSVHAFADAFIAKYDRLDVLINNAGIMMVPYGQTEDGFERQLGTNHLGHFALTGLLIDRIKATPNARVVNISSNGHKVGSVDFDNLQYEGGKGYSPMSSYGRSKLANILFTYELQKRFDANGVDAIAVAAHPGGSNTNLGNHLTDSLLGKLMMPIVSRMSQSAAMGALPTLRAAVDQDANGGDYFGPRGFLELAGNPIKVKTSARAQNSADQQQLWQASERLTGVSYL